MEPLTVTVRAKLEAWRAFGNLAAIVLLGGVVFGISVGVMVSLIMILVHKLTGMPYPN